MRVFESVIVADCPFFDRIGICEQLHAAVR